MKHLLPLVFLSLYSLFAHCQNYSETTKTVGFVYSSVKENQPLGTGFFVGIRVPGDTSKMFCFFVTAKHVLMNFDSSFHKSVLIRINTPDSARQVFAPLAISGNEKNIFFHPDPSVDIAVMLFNPRKTDYSLLPIDEALLLDKNSFSLVVPGQEIFFTGMFTNYLGKKKNFPIVRFGHVSLTTDERIDFVNCKRELFLVETFTFGGNSGSPVFVRVGYSEFRLLGVLNGFFGALSPVQAIQTGTTAVVAENSGIAAVTPSYLLKEIFEGTELSLLLKSVFNK